MDDFCMGLALYGILNDIHFPYEDKVAYELALKVLSDQPNLAHIYLNGDVPEFEAVTAHQKYMLAKDYLFEEVEYTNKRLDELQDRFPGTPITWISGNHEYRLERFLERQARELYGCGMDMVTLFNLAGRGIDWVPYGPRQLVKCGQSDLYLRHEPLSSSRTHSKITAEGSNVSIAYGHTHTYQEYSVKRLSVESPIITATAVPFLGDIKAKVFNYRGSKDNWQNGFAIVSCDTESFKHVIDVIIIEDNRCMFGGKIYEA